MSVRTEKELFTLWYDNQFGKPVNCLVEEEINCLMGTFSFKLFVASTRLKDAKDEIGKAIFKHRQN